MGLSLRPLRVHIPDPLTHGIQLYIYIFFIKWGKRGTMPMKNLAVLIVMEYNFKDAFASVEMS